MSRKTDLLRLVRFKFILGLALVAGLGLSHRLWFGERSLPVVPVFSAWPFSGLDFYLTCLLMIFTSVAVFSSRPKYPLLGVVLTAILLMLGDLNRFQPWFYQYIFLFGVLTFGYFRQGKTSGFEDTFNACQASFSGMYIWAGIQKLNVNFVMDTVPWLLSPLGGQPAGMILTFIGVCAAVFEITVGVFLLTNRFRKIGIYMSLAMHAFLLLTLGPLGHNWNSVVWPWNLAMPALIFVLFMDFKTVDVRQILLPRTFAHGAVFLAFLILPAFSFLGLWDSYLSFRLYSGNTQNAKIVFPLSDLQSLPEKLKQRADLGHLNLNNWAFGELNVPAYPEERYFVGVMKQVCGYLKADSQASLIIDRVPDWYTGKFDRATFSCADLSPRISQDAQADGN
jgi:hypothetical protein